MALITIPSNADLCAWLNKLTVSDIVFATSEADYVQQSLCALGAEIMAGNANASGGYLHVVIDPADNCLKWMAQPAPAVYDSTLIKPLMLTKSEPHTSYVPGTAYVDSCKLNLVTADFPVAMKLLVTWTVLARDPAVADQRLRWKPRGVVGGAIASIVADYIETHVLAANPVWVSSQYTAVLDIPAGPVGLYLAINYIEFNSAGATPIQLKIDAIAFKA